MRKIVLIGATFLTAASLAGCGGDEEGLRNHNNNLGVEPTRYNETMDTAPNRDRLEMDADEFGLDYYNNRGLNDRYNTRNITENENNGNFSNNDVTRNGDVNHNDERDDTFEVADRAAERITAEIDEVERAYVFKGPENAYVAVVLKNGNQADDGEIPDDLLNKIRRTVKSVDEDIDDVFVSTNPDFVKQAGDYSNQIEAGDPVEGLFKEMGDMFRRVFPNQ